ncbi:MAG TPA: class II glutamine amidotransferase, partial [Planctomycetaceae bacterium]|nr:class II glutamine amidotransferase [Planctomycetaceae bacterium]
PQALARTIGHVEQARQAAGIVGAIYFSACVSDGERIWAVRYSSNRQSRTLYHSSHLRALHDLDGTYAILPEDAVIVVSEPLDDLPDHWEEVPESSILTVESGSSTVTEFSPES